MGTMLETIQNVVIPEPEPEAEAQPVTTPPEDSTIENQLTQEISELWSNHTLLSASRKTTAKELRQIRARLAERLYAMKNLLSHPGRGGEWRGWLRERRIPRSTADRLVSRYSETLCVDRENVPSGAIPEPSEADIERLFNSLWPRLERRLPTPRSVYHFVRWFVGSFGLPYEMHKNGLLVLYPGVETPSATATAVMTEAVAASGDGVGKSGEVVQ
ncbi:MAG: hypothetical protein ABSH01_20505 [Terriglobia bacterium]|jgi:hypothetical protein